MLCTSSSALENLFCASCASMAYLLFSDCSRLMSSAWVGVGVRVRVGVGVGVGVRFRVGVRVGGQG